MIGDLAAQDDYAPVDDYGRLYVSPPKPDPRESLPGWAKQADAMPYTPEPSTSQVWGGRAPRLLSDLPDVGVPAIPSGPTWQGSPTANRMSDLASNVGAAMIPSSPLDFGLMAEGGPLVKGAGALGGYLFDSDPAEAGKGKAVSSAAKMGEVFNMGRKLASELPAGITSPVPRAALASPEDINRAASDSLRGITQPKLRALYDELGLTGGDPSELVMPSLAAKQPEAVVQEATDLKLADRRMLDTLTPQQRLDYQKKGNVPGMMLPSQEAAQPGLNLFAPIKKEVGRAEKEFDAQVAKGTRPSLFDLSPATLKQVPDVPQFALPRVAPGMTERLASVPEGGMARLERAAGAAPEENWGWYNLMQARDIFHGIHGPERGEQAFQAWLDGVAGTSMVNPIDNNLRSSTWYLQQMLQGNPLPQVLHIKDPETGKMVKAMAGGPPPGYGAKSQIQHADRVREYMTNTFDPVSNPKPISYRMNLSGNWVPRTVDTHDIRNMVGMPLALDLFGENAGLLPKEYSYLEGIGQQAADRAGSPQAAQQAATWVGGGDYTNLKSYPAPLLEALNRRAHVTAAVRGQTAWEALHDAFSGKRPLLGIAGGAVAAPVMGGLASQDEYQQGD